jgi:hypothetical protein
MVSDDGLVIHDRFVSHQQVRRLAMRFLNPLLIAMMLTGCSRSPKLPNGVTLSVAPSNDVIINLDDGRAVLIRQNKNDHRMAIVGNLDGKLQVVQLEQGGDTPRSMDLISRDKARFSVKTGSGQALVIILDEDGDGLPDTKIEGGKKFKRANIEWTEIPRAK